MDLVHWELHLRNGSCVWSARAARQYCYKKTFIRSGPRTYDDAPYFDNEQRKIHSDDDDDNDAYLLARVGRSRRKKGFVRSFVHPLLRSLASMMDAMPRLIIIIRSSS